MFVSLLVCEVVDGSCIVVCGELFIVFVLFVVCWLVEVYIYLNWLVCNFIEFNDGELDEFVWIYLDVL